MLRRDNILDGGCWQTIQCLCVHRPWSNHSPIQEALLTVPDILIVGAIHGSNVNRVVSSKESARGDSPSTKRPRPEHVCLEQLVERLHVGGYTGKGCS